MGYLIEYTIPTVPWDGIGMGPKGRNTVPYKWSGIGMVSDC